MSGRVDRTRAGSAGTGAGHEADLVLRQKTGQHQHRFRHEPGREHLAANRAQADAILDGLGRVGRRMDHVRDAFAGLDHVDPAASDDLHRARHALKDALARQRGASPADMRRITEILDRATAEILGLATNRRKES